MIRHIRKSDANVNDHRFRSTGMFLNKMRPTLCGAEPTVNDRARAEALTIIESANNFPQHLAHWIADLCPACRAALETTKGKNK